MTTRKQRLVYSAVSAAFAMLVADAAVFVFGVGTGEPFIVGRLFSFLVSSSWLSVPGWLVALPVILSFPDLRGWRYGALLALGFGIGAMIAVAMPRSFGYVPQANSFVALAATISLFATAIYLILRRGAEERTIRSTSIPVEGP